MCIYVYVRTTIKEVNRMEKEHGQIKFTETDDGFRIEVTGKKLKDSFSCCMPMFGAGKMVKMDCCPPEKEKKD
jgi:hypothetical protein